MRVCAPVAGTGAAGGTAPRLLRPTILLFMDTPPRTRVVTATTPMKSCTRIRLSWVVGAANGP